MIKGFAIKKSKRNFEKFPEIIKTFENSYEITEKTHQRYKKHLNLDRIISFLEMFDNLPETFDYKVVIKYQDKILDRVLRLRSEGKHQSVIDITLYEIFAKNKEQARLAYDQMVKNKTNKMAYSKGNHKDGKSLSFHIKKYGKDEGTKKYEEKVNNGHFRRTSIWCKEYWMERGYSEDEAIKQISESQGYLNTLDRYIEKYGMQEGITKFESRQKSRNEALGNKPQDEIDQMNLKKDVYYGSKKERGLSPEEITNLLNDDNSMKLNKMMVSNIGDFVNLIEKDKEKCLIYDYIHINEIIAFYTKTQFKILEIDNPFEFLNNYIKVINKYCDDEENEKQLECGKYLRNYILRIDEGLLRSSYEILFYRLIKERNIKFSLDKKYIRNNKNSFRYDFYLPEYERYVEISPLYNYNKDVKEKIDKKKNLFGCDVLITKEDISNYVKSLS